MASIQEILENPHKWVAAVTAAMLNETGTTCEFGIRQDCDGIEPGPYALRAINHFRASMSEPDDSSRAPNRFTSRSQFEAAHLLPWAAFGGHTEEETSRYQLILDQLAANAEINLGGESLSLRYGRVKQKLEAITALPDGAYEVFWQIMRSSAIRQLLPEGWVDEDIVESLNFLEAPKLQLLLAP